MIAQTNESLEMLVMVSRLLSSKLDISELLVTIMRLASRVVGAERASLYLLDEKKQELYFDVALGLPEEVQKMRFKLGEGIAGTCAKEGKSIIIADAVNDPRHSKKADAKSGFVTRSLLTCPMIIKGKVIGVVQAVNRVEGTFEETDKNNFEAFASQAAIAIENSRLFNNVKEEKNKLDVVFKKIKEGAILTKPDGEIVILNHSASLYLEYDKYNLPNVVDVFEKFNFKLDLEQVMSCPDYAYKFELERDKPKKLILDVSVVKLTKESKEEQTVEGLVWIITDVTEQRMEERMARNFLSLISHKFKTPLAAINGYAQLLSENAKGDLPEMVKRSAASIYGQGIKLASLIETLLDFVGVESLNPAEVNLAEMPAEDLLMEMESEIKDKNPEVTVKVAVLDKFSVNADRTLLKKALRHLVDNGLKFNKSQEKLIILSAQMKDGKKMISVGDNGIGIPGEEISRIFNKFYQVEASFTGQVEGWGLGLALVKKIVEFHRGRIFVKSQLEKGSAFTIVLE